MRECYIEAIDGVPFCITLCSKRQCGTYFTSAFLLKCKGGG